MDQQVAGAFLAVLDRPLEDFLYLVMRHRGKTPEPVLQQAPAHGRVEGNPAPGFLYVGGDQVFQELPGFLWMGALT